MTANDARTGGMSWVPFGPSSSAHEMLARISFRLPVYTLTVPVKKFPPPRRVHRSSKTPLTGEPGAHSQNTSNATVHASRSVWRALTVNPGALASRSAHVGYSGTVHCKLSRGFIHSEYTQQQIMLDIPSILPCNIYILYTVPNTGLTENTALWPSRPLRDLLYRPHLSLMTRAGRSPSLGHQESSGVSKSTSHRPASRRGPRARPPETGTDGERRAA